MNLTDSKKIRTCSSLTLFSAYSMSHCVLASMLCCLLTQCSTTTTDPAYASLMATAEPNPQANEIVGMWHRMSNDTFKHRDSLLFNSNGTGIFRAYSQEMNDVISQTQMTWGYQHSGVWVARTRGLRLINLQYRLSGNRLLCTGSSSPVDGPPFFKFNLVFERVH